jgi:cytochrome c biogenesis protein CcdA
MIEDLSLSGIGLSLVAGSLTTLSPCVFPMLPLVVGGAMQSNRLAPVAMGAGMVVSFSLIGLLLGVLGPLLGIDSESVRQFGGVMLVAFSAVMLVPWLDARFSAWMSPIAASANAASTGLDEKSLLGALLLGALLGLVWSPCSGPLLGTALTLVASEGGAVRGAAILGIFGIGAAVPLVAVAYASRGGFTRFRDVVQGRIGIIKKAFGILIGLTGLAILSGGDKMLETWVLDRLPEGWIRLTTLF